jgi:DNA primase
MKGRGYDIDELALKGVGYCTKGPYKGRIITPFYENGRVVYFNARKFIDVGEKHKNPSINEFGVGKSLLIYNVDALWLYNRTYLVESATNALTLGDRAIATGGKKLSNYQVSKIIKSPCKEVSIVLDKDAWWEALQLGLKLSPHKRVRLIEMPDDRDVNELGKKKSLKLIKKSKVLSYKEIYKLFINTEKPEHYLPTV